MRYNSLKKQTIIHTAIIALIILAAIGGYLIVLSFEDSYNQELSSVTRELTRINSQSLTLDNRVAMAQRSLKLYQSIQSSGGDSSNNINRRWAKEKLDTLKDRYRLGKLTLKMTPLEELTNKRFKRTAAITMHTEVTLQFSGLTDSHLFSFIEAIKQEFSGYIRIDSLRISRKSEISNDTLRSISKGVIPDIVDGEVMFHWLSLKSAKEGE